MRAFFAAVFLALLLSFPARSDETAGNLQHFEPSLHAGDMITVGTAARPHDGFSGGAFVAYGKDLLALSDERWGDAWSIKPVEHLLSMDLFAAFAAWESASFALDLPVALFAHGAGSLDGKVPGGSGAGLGDLRLAGRYLVIPRDGNGFGLGVEAGLAAPTSIGAVYMGSRTVTGTPAVIVDYRILDTLVAFNLAYRFQGGEKIGSQDIGGGLRTSLGASHDLFGDRLQVLGELLFMTSQEEFFTRTGTTLEGMLGASANFGGWFRPFLAAGGGFLAGYGEPSFRMTAGVRVERLAPPEPETDRDGDGIPDRDDDCPDVRGKESGESGRNGCPPDSDRDGIQDNEDACPSIPGVKHRDPKRSGCPADEDGDGVFDRDDACPTASGIKSSDPTKNGCPPDEDGDGVIDSLDACPKDAGHKTDDPKTRGCPPDRDGDGIWDKNDSCPDIAGDVNAESVLHGCPKPKVTREKIEILQRIEFELGKTDLLPQSFPILDGIAQVILEHPEVLKVTIEGHTDGTNTQEFNLPLSQKRAQAVLDYLVRQGIARDRLEAKGFGMSKPIADNGTEEGRKTNRRVELRVQMAPEGEQAPVPTPLPPEPDKKPEQPSPPPEPEKKP